jgi:hypothetical protein
LLVRFGSDPKVTRGDRVMFKDAGARIASVEVR